MLRGMHPRRLTVVALLPVVLVSACGGTAAVAPAAQPAVKAEHTPQPIDRLTATARAAYRNQVSGPHSIDILHQVGRDPTLLRLLGSHNLRAARTYVARQFHDVWYHWHVSRMRIRQGSTLVTENGVRFCLAASQMVLRAGGRNVGTLQVSMQDEIGFVRLMHRRYAVQVVIRGRGPAQLRASMRAAGLAKLPARGDVSLHGRRYAVRSFHELSWNGEPVTIWILMKA
jgi:hypothetical protein